MERAGHPDEDRQHRADRLERGRHPLARPPVADALDRGGLLPADRATECRGLGGDLLQRGTAGGREQQPQLVGEHQPRLRAGPFRVPRGLAVRCHRAGRSFPVAGRAFPRFGPVSALGSPRGFRCGIIPHRPRTGMIARLANHPVRPFRRMGQSRRRRTKALRQRCCNRWGWRNPRGVSPAGCSVQRRRNSDDRDGDQTDGEDTAGCRGRSGHRRDRGLMLLLGAAPADAVAAPVGGAPVSTGAPAPE